MASSGLAAAAFRAGCQHPRIAAAGITAIAIP
jgi:hypothetical protein